jgi:two-component system alkaline phosphatase synthesis response regulator PhoP
MVLTLSDRLRSEGYVVDHEGDGEAGEKLAGQNQFDLIILDVMLPQRSGFDVCRNLRQRAVMTPILMLTARAQLNEKVVGLKLGADDYMTKPFETLELLARVESLLRRPNYISTIISSLESYTFGQVEIDFRKMEVRKNEVIVDLSAREFQLLRYFVQHRGDVLSREIILNGVWGYDSIPATRTIDTHVTWLRHKIEENPRRPQFIITVHGLGYKFIG